MAAIPYLQMQGILKRFPESNVIANRGVDFRAEQGEIHALVGENGAGKSTLMGILYGLVRPDEGRIFLKGREVHIESPHTAGRLGIGMLPQHFRLVPELTVAENVLLGREPRRLGIFLDREEAGRRVRAAACDFGFALEPAAPVASLSAGEKQQVEIIKLLIRDADLLILDEPFTALGEQERNRLFEVLKRLRDGGKAVILITHRLDEVLKICDIITVLRRGEVAASEPAAGITVERLARIMMEGELEAPSPRPERGGRPGPARLKLQGVSLVRQGERPLLSRVDLTVLAGEVMGVAALDGNGLRELEEVIAGLKRAHSGEILLGGRDVTGLSIYHRRRRGLAYIPADRLRRGCSLESPVEENLLVSSHHQFLRAGVFDLRAVRAFAQERLERFSIQASPDTILKRLSGGEIQKVILAREISGSSDFILFSEPTWGLDIASSLFLHRTIRDLRDRGAAILLLSSDLDDHLALADRIAVLRRGEIVARLATGPELTKELLAGYLVGSRVDPRPGEAG